VVVPSRKIYYFETDSGISLERRVAIGLLALISTLVQMDILCNTLTHVRRTYFFENFLHRTMKNSACSIAGPSTAESLASLHVTCTEGLGRVL
jgi:hypothetical protein